jgi:hypothetical protein
MKSIILVAVILTACFLVGERVSGWNRICYYDCLSGTVAVTVDAMEFCPGTIEED